MKPLAFSSHAVAILAALLASHATAQTGETCVAFDGYELQGDAARDPRTNLTWQRCAVGQNWTGTTCSGVGSRLTQLEAVELAKSSAASGWRLPTADELLSVVGTQPSCATAWRRSSPSAAVASAIARPVQGASFGQFWAATLETRLPETGIVVDFSTGAMHPRLLHYSAHVRFVRGQAAEGLSSNVAQDVASLRSRYEERVPADLERLAQAAKEQSEALAKEKLAREAQDRSRQVAATIQQQAVKFKESLRCEEGRDFASSQPQAERPSFDYASCTSERSFRAIERSRDPQAIYLAAVRYESQGDRSRGKSLYLVLMDRFSASPMAVKAADRLAALADVQAVERSNAETERTVRAARDAADRNAESVRQSVDAANSSAGRRAYEQCRIEQDACYARRGTNCLRNCESLLTR